MTARPGLVRVSGRSMEPTLLEGDLLLVLWGAPAKAGAMALLELPPDAAGQPRPLAVKRTVEIDPADPDRWWVEGDNLGVGVDSWTLGSLPRRSVRARVVTRLPRWRPRRPLGRSDG
ncbi:MULTISPECIES: peptidase S24 [unclassified Janibacter]|uniref:peptidase S24 n=1 Tax=unclassified Janibacter TaxID=2649294 RepID=UPI003CFCA954